MRLEIAALAKRILSANVGNLNQLDASGRVPLALAVEFGASPELVERLLECGAEVNQPDAHGQTPLALAARTGNEALVKLLLKHGASSRVPGWAPEGALSPLAEAAKNNHFGVMKLLHDGLLAEEKFPFSAFVRGQVNEALACATINGSEQSAKFLLEKKGWPMTYAALRDITLARICAKPVPRQDSEDELGLVKSLVDNGANVQQPGLLLSAINAGKTALVEFLMEKTKETPWSEEEATAILDASWQLQDPEMLTLVRRRANAALLNASLMA